MAVCEIDWCGRPVYGRKVHCLLHDQRRRNGVDMNKPLTAPRGAGTAFLKTLIGTEEMGCIQWPYARFRDGTGHAHIGSKSVVASRLMCILAHGEPPFPKAQAAHNCGKGHEACVNPNHLRWDTVSGNFKDKIGHGTQSRGSTHPVSKLTDPEVLMIRKLYAEGETQQSLANMFKVSRSNVGFIVNKQRWAHLRCS